MERTSLNDFHIWVWGRSWLGYECSLLGVSITAISLCSPACAYGCFRLQTHVAAGLGVLASALCGRGAYFLSLRL
jgi:hypothetical protein